MIFGSHVLLYSDDPDADRAFFRDVLGLRFVDVGHGWLIFALPPSELAVHPNEERSTVGDDENEQSRASAATIGGSASAELRASTSNQSPEPVLDAKRQGRERREPRLHAGHEMLGAHVYFMSDDLHAEVRALAAKGVACTEIDQAPWGIKTTIRLPSGGEIGLYQPKHETALERR